MNLEVQRLFRTHKPGQKEAEEGLGAAKERAAISDTKQYSRILTRVPWDLASLAAGHEKALDLLLMLAFGIASAAPIGAL